MINFKPVPSQNGKTIDLTPQEFKAFDSLDSYARLSPQAAADCYALFLQGYSTEQIAKKNPGFGPNAFGLVVQARLDFDWDSARDDYTRDLMIAVNHSVLKTTLEGIQFAADGMTVFHKTLGVRFQKFLQSGNPDDLGDYNYMSLKSYKDFVEIFQALMNKDDGKSPKPGVLKPQTESIAPGTLERIPAMPANEPISSESAEAMLTHLLRAENKKK